MKVRVRVRPPRFVVVLLLGLLAFGSLWMLHDPVVYVLGVDASATVTAVQPGSFCPGDTRRRTCYDVSLSFRPAGGAQVATSATLVASNSVSSGVTRGKVLPVRYLPFMPEVAVLRDYALDPTKLIGGLVLGWMAFMPLLGLLLRGSRPRSRDASGLPSYRENDLHR